MAEIQMDLQTILLLANGLISIAGNLAEQIARVKAAAKKAGATDEQLAELDLKLSAAIAAREAEQ